jgi:hypothetical protein
MPAGAGTPVPRAEAEAALLEATRRCRDVQVLTAEWRLSGRAGATRLGGTILAGLTAAGQIRLEATAPFGALAFVLAGDAGDATLVTRDNRVLTAPAERIVEALIGVTFDPASLLHLFAGCGTPETAVEDAARYPSLLAVRTTGGRTFLEATPGGWRLAAVERNDLLVDYRYDDARAAGWPAELRLRSLAGRAPALAFSVRQSQVEVDVPLPASAFTPVVPPAATPLTLEDLRAAGPLGEKRP